MRCIVCDRQRPFPTIFEAGGYALVRCPDCGLVFQDPQPAEEVLAGSYYHDPEFSALLMSQLRAPTLRRAAQQLTLLDRAGVLRGGLRALDVGCSSGAWLELARTHGILGVGVELGASTAAGARSRGLDVRTGTLAEHFGDGDPASERFELITFWDVLEHLRDPRRELALAARLLAPGGVIAVTLPNVEGFYPRLSYRLLARNTGAWEYPELPVHMYDFAPATIGRLLDTCGYEIVTMRTLPTPFAHYRQTTLSRAALGGGLRAIALRFAFELLRAGVYPAARLCGRGNSLFVVASRRKRSS